MAPAASEKAAAVTTTPQQVAARRSAEDLGQIHWTQDRWDCQQCCQWTGYVAGTPAAVINKLTANPTHPGGWLVTVRGKGGSYHKSLSSAQEEAANILAEVGEAIVDLFRFFVDLVARNEREEAEEAERLQRKAAAEEAEKLQRKAAAEKVIAENAASIAAFNAVFSAKHRTPPVAKASKPETKAKARPVLPRPVREPPRVLTPTPIKAKASSISTGIEDAILALLAGAAQTDAETAQLLEQPVSTIQKCRLRLSKEGKVVESGKKGRSVLWTTAQ